jgi:hypothetical protein
MVKKIALTPWGHAQDFGYICSYWPFTAQNKKVSLQNFKKALQSNSTVLSR